MAGNKPTRKSTDGSRLLCSARSRFAPLCLTLLPCGCGSAVCGGSLHSSGLIAALAFIVTFTNSLGGIASRADKVEAQRFRALDARNDDRRELERLGTQNSAASSAEKRRKVNAQLPTHCARQPPRRRSLTGRAKSKVTYVHCEITLAMEIQSLAPTRLEMRFHF